MYNHSLVAEPVRRATFTFPQQNRSFPIFPVTSAAPTKSGSSLEVTKFDGRIFSLGSRNQACEDRFSRLSTEKEASVATQLPMDERETGEKWTLDSNDFFFKTGNLSVAADGLLQSSLWAGPTEIPSWTFKRGKRHSLIYLSSQYLTCLMRRKFLSFLRALYLAIPLLVL